MNQPENALERLMNRAKPKVPSRNDVVEQTLNLDVKTQRQQETMTSSKLDEMDNSFSADSINQDEKTSLRLDLKTSIDSDSFETVRNTIRLETSVERTLRRICTEERITKETWFEAAYLYLSQEPEAMEEVVRLAKSRLEQRKQVADRRRADTMRKRVFGDQNP